ncbi:FixH family protein [Rhizobium sp. ARZ01]|uniref:FixH family protein n=1 Tax=Rhizobium sp. ARZ01 TaxID=2769313 RepID=UPI001786D497|nr:FixH family protein [Rhizobium sp. ARZ01]MBD9372618.1 FixH family protein [Rhizobium sp. ARZ01]
MNRTAKTPKAPFVFTGWHMLGIMLLFFGTIIAVNVVMAWNAVSSWSGLVVQNTYVASQQFNGKVEQAKAFAASGLEGALAIADGRVSYSLHDREGAPVTADSVTITFKRPVEEREDFELVLVAESGGNYSAMREMTAGQWIADISTVRGGEKIFHQTIRLVVTGESK